MGLNWGNGRTRNTTNIPTFSTTIDPLAKPILELGTPVGTDERLTVLTPKPVIFISSVETFVQETVLSLAFTLEGGRITVSRDDNSDTLSYNHAR